MKQNTGSSVITPAFVEIAWEVCNQVGGIYTVLKTKAPSMLSRWGSSYYLVGPYNPTSVQVEFEPSEPDALAAKVIESFNLINKKIYFGRWLIPSEPKVFLVDPREGEEDLTTIKHRLWEQHGVSTIVPDELVDRTLAFSSLAVQLIGLLAEHSVTNYSATNNSGTSVLAQFHEWMSAACISELRTNPAVRTVFTTHATLVGRYTAGDNRPLYQEFETIDPGAEATHYNIESRHQLERLAAQTCDVFTTVSDVTGKEAAQFLGRKPDYVLPNGLNAHHFTALHEFQNLHRIYKEKIHQFVMGHFFPSYTFDLERTLYFVISGRYEYRNKGMDIFLQSLERLNRRLMDQADPPTVVAFIVTNRPVNQLNVEALRGNVMLHDLTTLCKEIEHSMGEKIFNAALEKRVPSYEELLPRDAAARLKRAYLSFSRPGFPSISTHDILDPLDPVLCQLAASGLNNAKEHPVKVIYSPEFLSATNPPLHLDYDQFVRGAHLGVFPSYYEPWGYTPLECIALGLPTVTTDLSGFGAYVQENIASSESSGIYVLKRSLKSDAEISLELANYLFWFVGRSRRERIELRNKAERLTEHFDWSFLAKHYDEAHKKALA